MSKRLIVAGAGIGGMATACALAQNKQQVQVFEQASELSEFGAGIQIAPNAVRVLQHLNLMPAYKEVAAFPSHLQVQDGIDERVLGKLLFDDSFRTRYAAPYSTVHRADLHRILCTQAQQNYGIKPQLSSRLVGYNYDPAIEQIQVKLKNNSLGISNNADTEQLSQYQADGLIGADGLHSNVRRQLLKPESEPRYTGILAYRACVEQSTLPQALRSQHITAWLAPNWHIVHYPVRAGTHLNVVVLIGSPKPDDITSLDQTINAKNLIHSLHQANNKIQDLINYIPNWRLWALFDRAPVAGADAMAQKNIALLGDAAHPMRPFMAQGAGMALEDAATLAQQLQQHKKIEHAFAAYAQQRWQRCARVQKRSMRNGIIFHHKGLMMHMRNLAMRTLGSSIMDVPWLYGKGAFPVT